MALDEIRSRRESRHAAIIEAIQGGQSRASTEARPARRLRWRQRLRPCGWRVEPDVADQVAHHGEAMTVIDWARRLRCTACDGREVDFVVSGAAR